MQCTVVLPVLLSEGECLQTLFHCIRLSKRSTMLRLIKRPAWNPLAATVTVGRMWDKFWKIPKMWVLLWKEGFERPWKSVATNIHKLTCVHNSCSTWLHINHCSRVSMNAMHCSASRVAQWRGVLTKTFPPYQAKQEVHDAEADQEASLKPFGCDGYSWKDVGQVLEDSKNAGAAMEGRLRKTLEISSHKYPQTDMCSQFLFNLTSHQSLQSCQHECNAL